MVLNRAGMTRIVMVSACMFSSENIVYEDGKQACRGSLNGPFRVVFSRGVKSSSNTPVMQRTRRAHKERGWYAPHDISLASCPSGRRSGWAVRRFDSLVLSEVPDVILCLCAQGEGAQRLSQDPDIRF